MAGGARPDPFRTRKLSRRAPMVLRGKPVGEQVPLTGGRHFKYMQSGNFFVPALLLFRAPPPAMVAGRVLHFLAVQRLNLAGPGAAPPPCRLLLASSPPGAFSASPYVEEPWRTGKTPPRRPGYGNISPCRAAPKRPAARTLRTGYCEARGRAFGMVDRRETELKNHFDGEQ